MNYICSVDNDSILENSDQNDAIDQRKEQLHVCHTHSHTHTDNRIRLCQLQLLK